MLKLEPIIPANHTSQHFPVTDPETQWRGAKEHEM